MWRLRLVGLILYCLALAVACADSTAPHAAATGASEAVSFQWSLHFVDATTFAVGSSVFGSVSTGASAPVSLAGAITSNVGGVLSLSLANAGPGVESDLVLGSLNLSTGKFFGGIFSPGQAVRIAGTATLNVTGRPSRDIAPQIATVSPTSLGGPPSRTITITGAGFRSTQGTSTVTFAGQPALDLLSVVSWSDTQIVAGLAGFDSGSFPVYVTVGGVPSNPVTINVTGGTTFPQFSPGCTSFNALPAVAAFTVNGVEHRVIEAGPATLMWQVRNASGIRVQRLSGPGPAFDRPFQGGASVTSAVPLQFTLASCPGVDGCQDTIYRLTADNGCGRSEAHVTVRQVTSERTRELLNMQTVVVQRFDGHGLPSGMDGIIVPAHPGPSARPPIENLCFMNEGLPYLVTVPNAFVDTSVPIDPRDPLLLFYHPDSKLLTAWAYGRLYNREPRPPVGLPNNPNDWIGHWAGWHTGDGGMLRWENGLVPPPVPPASYCGPGTSRPSCGVLPYTVVHPAFWDAHFYRDFGAGPPRPGVDAGAVGLPDPCPRGAPFLDSNGRDLAFFPGTTGP